MQEYLDGCTEQYGPIVSVAEFLCTMKDVPEILVPVSESMYVFVKNGFALNDFRQNKKTEICRVFYVRFEKIDCVCLNDAIDFDGISQPVYNLVFVNQIFHFDRKSFDYSSFTPYIKTDALAEGIRFSFVDKECCRIVFWAIVPVEKNSFTIYGLLGFLKEIFY